ncbi:MAG TPA: tetratricopeptide repeat protein [Bryobacteraceae bacterium]
MRRAVEADPLAVQKRLQIALILSMTGRTQEAEREFHHAVELDENSFHGWMGLGDLHFARGEISEAIRCFEKASSLAPFVPRYAACLAGLLARTGHERRAEELLAKLGPPETYGVPLAWALFHLFRGETEKAVDWWEKAIDQRDSNAVIWPRFNAGEALRKSLRWPALAKRMNLPESAW